MGDIEALGRDTTAPMGPQQGSNATWDGGGGPAGVAAASLRDQLGVFEGYSDDDDFNWSLISSVRPQPRPENPGGSSSPDARGFPQVDGAGDDSASGDSASRPDLQDMDGKQTHEADSRDSPKEKAVRPLGAGQQRVGSAGSQQTQSSSQRFGSLPLQKASPSTASAPVRRSALEDTAAAQAGEHLKCLQEGREECPLLYAGGRIVHV